MTENKVNLNNVNIEAVYANGFKGKERDDIETVCRTICRCYLGGDWLRVPLTSIEVKKLNVGVTNHLYLCTHSCDDVNSEKQWQQVVIRLYGDNHFCYVESEQNERIADAIISVLVSENKLCPKIYGIFKSGVIMKYNKNKQFENNQLSNTSLAKSLAKKLALIHSLSVPIRRNRRSPFDTMRKVFEEALVSSLNDQLINELKEWDMKKEIDWLENIVNQTESPIVFSHMDFRSDNILVIDNEDAHEDANAKILICDFDHSDYYWRGHDFATLFISCGPYNDQASNLADDFFDDSVCEKFLEYYLEESGKLYENNNYRHDANNSVKHLLRETKVFALVIYLLRAALIIQLSEHHSPASDLFDACHQNPVSAGQWYFKNYSDLKKILLERNEIE